MYSIRILAAAITLMAAGSAAQAQQTIYASTLQQGHALAEPGHPQYLLNRCAKNLQQSKFVTQRNILKDQQPTEDPTATRQFCEVIKFQGKTKKLQPFIKSFNDAFAYHCSDSTCYRCVTFNSGDKARAWKLAYGDSPEAYVEIGSTTSNQMNYVFSCFTDPGWPDYRTCYAVEWYDTGEEIIGRYIKTYARIPQQEAMSVSSSLHSGKDGQDPFLKFSRELKLSSDSIHLPFSISPSGRISFGSERTSDYYLRNFNIVQQKFYKEETADAGNLAATAIYSQLKEAAASGVLSADEREVLCCQLNDLIEFCDSQIDSLLKSGKAGTAARSYYSTSRDYFRLAIKVLRGNP